MIINKGILSSPPTQNILQIYDIKDTKTACPTRLQIAIDEIIYKLRANLETNQINRRTDFKYKYGDKVNLNVES